MDDEFGDDADFAALAASVERTSAPKKATTSSATATGKIQQPTPQALPSRSAPSSILVSTRQKGNPSLNYIKSLPWEYSDIPADYVLGATTCALFLSLKYHRLHPEYIYSRIRALGHKYNLRVLLTMVDIQNHEESLKELSKTSMINNLTLILCWSAAEAGRYLELYKSYEHASPTSIRAHQATSYSEKVVEFITVPRSINKTDAVSLVSAFGSIRAAVNARPEEIGEITGWGEKKVQRWCQTVRENFRVRKATKRGVDSLPGETTTGLTRNESSVDNAADDLRGSAEPNAQGKELADMHASRPIISQGGAGPVKRHASEVSLWEPGDDDDDALLAAAEAEGLAGQLASGQGPATTDTAAKPKESLNAGVADALAKLRKQ